MLTPAQHYILRPDVDRIAVERQKRQFMGVASYGYTLESGDDRLLYELYRSFRSEGGIPDLLHVADLSLNHNLINYSEFLSTTGWSKYSNGGTAIQANVTLNTNNGVLTVGSDPTPGATWSFFGTSSQTVQFVAGQSYNFRGTITTTIPNFTLNIFTSNLVPSQSRTFATPGTYEFDITATSTTSGTSLVYYRSASGSGSATQVTFTLTKLQIAAGGSTSYRRRDDNTAPKSLNLGTLGSTGDGTLTNGTVANVLVQAGNQKSYTLASASSQSVQHTAFTAWYNQYSYGIWINPTTLGGAILNKGATTDRIVIEATGAMRFSANTGQVITGAGAVTTGTPQFWFFNVNGLTVDIYKNGVLQSVTNTISARPADNTGAWNISTVANYNGRYNAPQFWGNKNLTAQQIMNLYNTQKYLFGY